MPILLSWAAVGLSELFPQDLAVKAYVDKTVVGLGQEFSLSVEISGKDAGDADDPVLPAMDAFAAFLGSGSSQNIQFVNGRMSVSRTITYHYQTSATGKFTIGAVRVAHKGKEYTTVPIDITIQDAPVRQSRPAPARRSQAADPSGGLTDQDLFVRASVSKKTLYPNEPAVITYRLYTRQNVTSLGISKLPASSGFWTEEFELPQQLITSNEVLNGIQYTTAVIKKIALFPTGPGAKTIEPMVIDCDVQVRRAQSNDPFSNFFDDSFFFGRTVRKTLTSPSLELEVLPFPAEGKPVDFSGLTGSFRIESSVDKKAVKTNEAITYRIKISGQGNIKAIPQPQPVFPGDFEVYPPKSSETIDRSGQTVSGSKTFEYVLIPRIQGRQRILPVKLTYFDPASRKYRTAETREAVIEVEKGSDMFTAVPSGLSKQEVKLLGQDIRFIKLDSPSFSRIGDSPVRHALFWIVLLLPLSGIAAAYAYRRHVDRLSGDIGYAREKRASRLAKKGLASASALVREGRDRAFYAEVGNAMTRFLGDKLNIAEAGMISDEVKARLGKAGVDQAAIDAYFDCLGLCDLKRFSPAGSDLNEMKEFLGRAEKALSSMARQLK
ncbi:protein BatD [bacterium]|nr:protein BatD [bacterium]